MLVAAQITPSHVPPRNLCQIFLAVPMPDILQHVQATMRPTSPWAAWTYPSRRSCARRSARGGMRLASAARVAYRLRQAAQRARDRLQDGRQGAAGSGLFLRCCFILCPLESARALREWLHGCSRMLVSDSIVHYCVTTSIQLLLLLRSVLAKAGVGTSLIGRVL